MTQTMPVCAMRSRPCRPLMRRGTFYTTGFNKWEMTISASVVLTMTVIESTISDGLYPLVITHAVVHLVSFKKDFWGAALVYGMVIQCDKRPTHRYLHQTILWCVNSTAGEGGDHLRRIDLAPRT